MSEERLGQVSECKPPRNLRCELISGEDVSYLEGRLKTFIDSIIPETLVVQNKATKDIIRVILWDWFNFITGHFTDHLVEKREWYKESQTDKPNPKSETIK